MRARASARSRPIGTTSESLGSLTSAGRVVVCAMAVAVPVVFDPSARGAFNAPKFAVVCWGALALLVLGAAVRLRSGRSPIRRTGLAWPVVALTAWTGVATVFGLNLRLSLVGNYESHDGLLLAVAAAVVFFGAASALEHTDVRTVLSWLYLGAGGAVSAYGLLQLHDVLAPGSTWDPVTWASPGLVVSTLANPNHVGAFAATLLPIGAVLFVTERRRWWRAGIAAVAAAAAIELIQTLSRGAIVGAGAAAATLAIALARDILSRPRKALLVAAVACGALLAAALTLAATGGLVQDPASLLRFEFGSSAGQRVSWWRIAMTMGSERPLAGYGPELYAWLFPRYVTMDYFRASGVSETINGPHNMVLNALATTGVIGAMLTVAVLGALAWRCVAGLRSLGRLVNAVSQRGASEHDHATTRLLLAGITAALVAMVTQSMFNVQQVALTFCFWLLAALACVCARAAHQGRPESGTERAAVHRPVRGAAAAAAAAIGLAAILGFLAAGPWRANRRFLAADALHTKAESLLSQLDPRPAALTAEVSKRQYEQAIAAYPWEAQYRGALGDLLSRFAEHRATNARSQADVSEALRLFGDARTRLEEAVRLLPQNVSFQVDYASVLLNIAALDTTKRALTGEAIAVLTHARRDNPWKPRIPELLSLAFVRQGDAMRGLEAARSGLDRFPGDPGLLRAALAAARASGEAGQAARYEAELKLAGLSET